MPRQQFFEGFFKSRRGRKQAHSVSLRVNMQTGQLAASARADRALLATVPEPGVSALRVTIPRARVFLNASPGALGPGSRRHYMPASLPLRLLRVPFLLVSAGTGSLRGAPSDTLCPLKRCASGARRP